MNYYQTNSINHPKILLFLIKFSIYHDQHSITSKFE